MALVANFYFDDVATFVVFGVIVLQSLPKIQQSLRVFHEAAIKHNLWRAYLMPTKKNETNSKLVSSLSLLHAVLFLELVHASAGVYQLLLAREIRMALVANFYFDDVGILGCTGLESSATSTYNSRFMIIWMYTLFHCRLPRFIFGLCPCVPNYFTIMRKNSQAICITLVRKLHRQ